MSEESPTRVRESVNINPEDPASLLNGFAFFREHIDELYRQMDALRHEQYTASFLLGAVAALQVIGRKDVIPCLAGAFEQIFPGASSPVVFDTVYNGMLAAWTDPPPGDERPPEEVTAQILAFATKRAA